MKGVAERSDVTSENWLDAPYNRVGFIRVGELARTEPISRGDGPVLELPRAERDLDSVRFEFQGEEFSFQRFLESTFTDGLLVLHEGTIVFESYAGAMQPSEKISVAQAVSALAPRIDALTCWPSPLRSRCQSASRVATSDASAFW